MRSLYLLFLILCSSLSLASAPDPRGYPSELPVGTRLSIHSGGKLMIPAGTTMFEMTRASGHSLYRQGCTVWLWSPLDAPQVLDGTYTVTSTYSYGMWVRSEYLGFGAEGAANNPVIRGIGCTLESNEWPTNADYAGLLEADLELPDADLELPEAAPAE